MQSRRKLTLPSHVYALALSLFGKKCQEPGVHTIPADADGYIWHLTVVDGPRVISLAAIPQDLATRETLRAFFAWRRSCTTASGPARARVLEFVRVDMGGDLRLDGTGG